MNTIEHNLTCGRVAGNSQERTVIVIDPDAGTMSGAGDPEATPARAAAAYQRGGCVRSQVCSGWHRQTQAWRWSSTWRGRPALACRGHPARDARARCPRHKRARPRWPRHGGAIAKASGLDDTTQPPGFGWHTQAQLERVFSRRRTSLSKHGQFAPARE